MRSEVGEWLATCVGSPICILLLSWSLLIYQNQPSSLKRRIDVLTVAIIAQSLAHQLGLLLYAILTLIRPTNHFGELCSTLVWLLNSSSILQALTLTSIAIFAAINKDESSLTKNHIKYHLVSLTVVSACIGFTGVLNFEPETCVFLAHEVSPKYGLFVNSLRGLLLFGTICGLIIAMFKDAYRNPKSELLQSVSDLSDTSSKNSSGAFECHPHHWDPSNGSCTSGSTNSRACLRKRKLHVDESGSKSTVFSILFVCYIFDHLPILVVSIRPEVLNGFCTPQNVAIWLPLIKDTLLPMFLAIFDKMFCQYVAKVYTKQDNSRKLAHCGVDGKFRHFEQDAEYKLQLNLNHGLKFPLTNGSLYGRLHTHQNRPRTGTITMGIQHYPRIQSLNDDNNYGSLPAELTSFTSSTFEPRAHKDVKITSILSVTNDQQQQQQSIQRLIKLNENFDFSNRRKIGSIDVFGQNMENLVQLEEPKRKFSKSLDEIHEEVPKRKLINTIILDGIEKEKLQHNSTRKEEEEFTKNLVRRNQSFDSTKYPRLGLDYRTYDVKDLIRKDRNMDLKREVFDQEIGYDTSDDESCDYDNEDFNDTMSSCKSRSRSCCSVTTVANDDFEFFQRKETKVELFPIKKITESKINMRSFTPKIIENSRLSESDSQKKIGNNKNLITKPIIQSYHLKKITPGFSMNDLDKIYPNKHQLNLSVINNKNSSVDYFLNNGLNNISRQNIGGSAPDLKKIFISELM
ncbi:hypothetical protein PV327_009338 [Microctonus hyperodae]|uniref:Uncharacterized protein n=1 Tax=Microctonus hyperodae TaxID=165561 RepID=A0AA39KVL6_MICHY|nr:hypothetical protein PV327_009338 [Microctonus hyperodae]